MTDGGKLTLTAAARRYFADLSPEERGASQADVERFVRWVGGDRSFEQLRGHEVANYAETLSGGVTDAGNRADAVRKFLLYAKKAGYSTTNLGAHLRLRKGTGAKPKARGPALKEVHISQVEKDALVAELETLKAMRPTILQDIQRARADKDFRENAPLDAAREQQGHVESRIRAVETTLDRAVIVEDGPAPTGDAADIGSTVVVHNVASGKDVTYTLVRPGEINAAEGRISFESPVGRALRGKRPGDEVEVAAPSGTLTFRVQSVQH